jgi:hypothetical protein
LGGFHARCEEKKMHDLILFAQDDAGAKALGGFFSLICVFWVIGIIATIFWLWMLIDALMNEPTTNEKILWSAHS